MWLSSICCSRYCSTASTTQHITNGSHDAAAQVRSHQRATTQASRQSLRAGIMSSIYKLAEVSNRTKEGRSAYSKRTYNYSHIAVVMLQGFAFSFDPSTTQYCSFSPYLTSTYHACVRRPGCCPGTESSCPFQVVSLHLKSWTSLSASSSSQKVYGTVRHARCGNLIYYYIL